MRICEALVLSNQINLKRKTRSPLEVFHELANVMGHRHDPCVLDALISVKRFLNGEPAKPWWRYTGERRKLLANHVKGESK